MVDSQCWRWCRSVLPFWYQRCAVLFTGRFLHAQAKQLTLISFFCPCMMHMITASENWQPPLAANTNKKAFHQNPMTILMCGNRWSLTAVTTIETNSSTKASLFLSQESISWTHCKAQNRVGCNGITESALVESFQGIHDKQEGHNLRKFQKHSIVTWCMGVEMLHMVCTCGDGKDMVLFIACNENTACIHKIYTIIWVHTVSHSKHAKY